MPPLSKVRGDGKWEKEKKERKNGILLYTFGLILILMTATTASNATNVLLLITIVLICTHIYSCRREQNKTSHTPNVTNC